MLENVLEDKKRPVEIQHPQCQELIALWGEVIQEMKNSPPQLYSYWKTKAHALNKAMGNERYLIKKREITFDEYMETAIDSVGIIFIWAAYIVKKNISMSVRAKLESVFPIGARIARLSNDIASHRQNKNRINAIRIIKNQKNPVQHVVELIKKERQKLSTELQKLKEEHEIAGVVQRSTDFLVEFYNTSDFDT